MDFLSSLGMKGYSNNDKAAQKFDEGFLQLQQKYPTLGRTSKLARKSTSTAVPFLEVSDIHTLSSSSSKSESILPTASNSTSKAKSAPVIDYSCSKLAQLDQPGNSFTPEPRMGKRKLKAIKKKLKDRTKGPNWFEMTAPEITDERKNDLEALRLRGALDTKRFYKRNSGSVKPKHFHVGKIVGNAADFYNCRVPKKQRKMNIAEEMLAENKTYNR